VELSWAVTFPETDALGHGVGQIVELGRNPENLPYLTGGNKLEQRLRHPLNFQPGQEMKISLAPYADQLRTRIEQHQPFSTIHTCFINVYAGYFEDGMQWLLGEYNVPDPGHPGHFKPVDPSE